MSPTRCTGILTFCCLVLGVAAQAPAPAGDGLLLPVSIGVLLKVIFVVFGVLVKLLFLGLTSLGGSGLAVLLTVLFLKNHGWSSPPLLPGHHHGWGDRNWPLVRTQYFHPGQHRQHYGKQMNEWPYLYKPETGEHNGLHPVPVDAIDPRSVPHQRMRSETENVSLEKETPNLAHTQPQHAPAN